MASYFWIIRMSQVGLYVKITVKYWNKSYSYLNAKIHEARQSMSFMQEQAGVFFG